MSGNELKSGDESKSGNESKSVDELKMALNLQAKMAMREHLLNLSWGDKVASIARMNAAAKLARQAMDEAMARKADESKQA